MHHQRHIHISENARLQQTDLTLYLIEELFGWSPDHTQTTAHLIKNLCCPECCSHCGRADQIVTTSMPNTWQGIVFSQKGDYGAVTTPARPEGS